MASNINDTGVNKDYPVAGQDNDSQGFRDNFSVIKDNFVAAKSEIETLQTNTAKLNASNNFLGNNIQNANLINNSYAYFAGGTVNSSQNVNYSNGNYQAFTVGADITLTLSEWPVTGKAGVVRLFINNDNSQRTITFASNAGAGTLKRSNGWAGVGNTFNIDTPNTRTYVFEFISYDAGATVFADYIGYFE
jgi:hypothetical protein|tara:strand:- start:1721 stop:2293 length:573 start_codon:yes stop_codon:yes gene_type:complete